MARIFLAFAFAKKHKRRLGLKAEMTKKSVLFRGCLSRAFLRRRRGRSQYEEHRLLLAARRLSPEHIQTIQLVPKRGQGLFSRAREIPPLFLSLLQKERFLAGLARTPHELVDEFELMRFVPRVERAHFALDRLTSPRGAEAAVARAQHDALRRVADVVRGRVRDSLRVLRETSSDDVYLGLVSPQSLSDDDRDDRQCFLLKSHARVSFEACVGRPDIIAERIIDRV